MKKYLLTLGLVPFLNVTLAQDKSDLSDVPELLSSPISIASWDGIDVYTNNQFSLDKDYTLEVVASVEEAERRGMDIEAKSLSGEGFRIFITPDNIYNAPFKFNIKSIVETEIENWDLNRYRITMSDNVAKIFRNGELLSIHDKVYLEGINCINDNDATFNNGAFEEGLFEGWTAQGVGETVEILEKPITNPESEQELNNCLHVSFPGGLNGVDAVSNLILGLKPGATYDLSYRFLPYLRNNPGGGNNITVGVYADNSSLTSLVAAWHNGFAYNATSEEDPKWTDYTMRFTMPENLDFVYLRIIARNNPCNIYFDDFAITEVEYPTDFPEFKEIPADEVHDREANTGIYNKTNLLWDHDPGFEYSQHNGSFNSTEDGVLPKEEARWFANGNLNGPGDARTLDTSLSTGYDNVEGNMVAMIRYDYTYNYFSLKLPLERLKPNSAYKIRYRAHAFKAPSNNFQYYFRVSEDINGVNKIYNSVLATVPEFVNDDPETEEDETFRNSEFVELPFFTPVEMPENIYATFRIKNKADILFGVDEFVLVESAEDYEPKGKITIGKNFYAGIGVMNIESVKCVETAYLPDDNEGASINNVENEMLNLSYNNGILSFYSDADGKIEIYDMAGINLFNSIISEGDQRIAISLNTGVYVAKINDKTVGFVVK